MRQSLFLPSATSRISADLDTFTGSQIRRGEQTRIKEFGQHTNLTLVIFFSCLGRNSRASSRSLRSSPSRRHPTTHQHRYLFSPETRVQEARRARPSHPTRITFLFLLCIRWPGKSRDLERTARILGQGQRHLRYTAALHPTERTSIPRTVDMEVTAVSRARIPTHLRKVLPTSRRPRDHCSTALTTGRLYSLPSPTPLVTLCPAQAMVNTRAGHPTTSVCSLTMLRPRCGHLPSQRPSRQARRPPTQIPPTARPPKQLRFTPPHTPGPVMVKATPTHHLTPTLHLICPRRTPECPIKRQRRQITLPQRTIVEDPIPQTRATSCFTLTPPTCLARVLQPRASETSRRSTQASTS